MRVQGIHLDRATGEHVGLRKLTSIEKRRGRMNRLDLIENILLDPLARGRDLCRRSFSIFGFPVRTSLLPAEIQLAPVEALDLACPAVSRRCGRADGRNRNPVLRFDLDTFGELMSEKAPAKRFVARAHHHRSAISRSGIS